MNNTRVGNRNVLYEEKDHILLVPICHGEIKGSEKADNVKLFYVDFKGSIKNHLKKKWKDIWIEQKIIICSKLNQK